MLVCSDLIYIFIEFEADILIFSQLAWLPSCWTLKSSSRFQYVLISQCTMGACIVHLKVLYFKQSVKKALCSKGAVNVYHNFSNKFAFASLFSFCTNQKQRFKSSGTWCTGNKIYFAFLLIASLAYIKSRSTSKAF